MRIGFHNLYSQLNPLLFTERNAPIGDDLLLPFNRLGELAKSRGHECVALGPEVKPASLDAVVFIDFPDLRDPCAATALGTRRLKKYLITMENGAIYPPNFDKAWHSWFEKVFTWHDGLIEEDPSRYVKINYAQEFDGIKYVPTSRKLLCAMSSNKVSSHPESLYGVRRSFYKLFADQWHFDLYGQGWEGYPYWRGAVPPGLKREVIAQYQFCLVIENAKFPGYITEKIFDAMIAGCVPIYLGAPNVERWIPGECFLTLVDDFNFNLAPETYQQCRQAIDDFLASPKSIPFQIDAFTRTVLDTVTGG